VARSAARLAPALAANAGDASPAGSRGALTPGALAGEPSGSGGAFPANAPAGAGIGKASRQTASRLTSNSRVAVAPVNVATARASRRVFA
jgi:hypothetical protein